MRRALLLVAVAVLSACGGDDAGRAIGAGAAEQDGATSSTSTSTSSTTGSTTSTTVAPSVPADDGSTTTTVVRQPPPTTTSTTEAPATRADYVDAFVTLFSGEFFVPFQDDPRCAAEAFVDGLGLETFRRAGVSPQDIVENQGNVDLGDPAPEVAEDLVDRLLACDVDRYELLFSDGTNPLDPELRRCVVERLDPDQAREILVTQLAGTDPSAQADAAYRRALEC